MRRAAALLAILLGGAVFAQVRETMTVNLVEVPVTVVDGNGDPVRGLSVANFELLDNGTARRITAFDRIDFATSDTKAISPLNPAARRQFLLLFDLSYSGPKALQRARQAAQDFLEQNVQPRDLVGIATIDVDHGFRLLTAFTTDRRLVADAMSDPAAFKGSDPLQIASNPASFDVPDLVLSTGGQTVPKSQSNAALRAHDEDVETAQLGEKANENFTRQRIDRMVDGLGRLANMLRAVPGRKQIVLLTEGFDPKYVQGRDVRAANEGMLESEAAVHGQVWTVDQDARYGNTQSQSLVGRMAQYFRQSDVVLHAIDIQGLRLQEDIQHGSTINSNAGLFLLARPTGGEVFQNVNDLKSDFARMIHQQEVVYVLGFQAPPQKPGSFHALKVRLVNVPNARASYRAGYFESGGETPQQRTLSNAEIIVNDIPQNDLRLHALAAAFPEANGVAQVPVIVEINGSDLSKDVRGAGLRLEVYIYAFDSDGVVRDRLYQNVTLDVSKVGAKLRAGGVKYYGTLLLAPGTYAVKSLVRSVDDDRRGFARTDLVVPKLSDVAALQAIPIDDAPNGVLVKGSSHAPKAAYPFVLNGQQFIPAAAVRRNGAPQKIALFVYNAPAQSLTWETTPKTTVLGHADGLGQSAVVLRLDAANANSLDITVHRSGSSEARKVSVPIVE